MPKSSWSWGFICSCYMWVWSSMVKLIGWYTYTDPKRELLILGCGMLYRIAPRLDHSGLPPQTPSSELPHYFAWSWFGFLWTDASESWCSVSTAFIPRTFSDQDVSWISAILIHLSNPMLHNWDISYLTIIPLPRTGRWGLSWWYGAVVGRFQYCPSSLSRRLFNDDRRWGMVPNAGSKRFGGEVEVCFTWKIN